MFTSYAEWTEKRGHKFESPFTRAECIGECAAKWATAFERREMMRTDTCPVEEYAYRHTVSAVRASKSS